VLHLFPELDVPVAFTFIYKLFLVAFLGELDIYSASRIGFFHVWLFLVGFCVRSVLRLRG